MGAFISCCSWLWMWCAWTALAFPQSWTLAHNCKSNKPLNSGFFLFCFVFVFPHYLQWNFPVLSWFLSGYFITAIEMKPDCWEIILSPGFWGFTLWCLDPVCLGWVPWQWQLVVEEAFHLLKTRSRETEEKQDRSLPQRHLLVTYFIQLGPIS